ncbi:MAG: nuclear transport factor 2 family protein [Pseudomonadota bacterium]
MTDPSLEALEHMLSAWNEQDGTKLRGHLERALTDDVHFVDPSIDLHGIDAFEQNVRSVHARLPGARYLRTSRVDAQHNWCRYHWAIEHNGVTVIEGFDTTELRDGRVSRVVGFFGPLRIERSSNS